MDPLITKEHSSLQAKILCRAQRADRTQILFHCSDHSRDQQFQDEQEYSPAQADRHNWRRATLKMEEAIQEVVALPPGQAVLHEVPG